MAESISMAGFTKKVAIKRILPGLIKEERFVRMFLDEARISLRLNHANIVTVFDIGESDETYFIVMDFIEGTNIKTLLEHQAKKGRHIPIRIIVWILTEILRGLQYAHDLIDQDGKPFGIIHRDISPPNILLSWNGEVKLVDFGLAKATTQVESTDPGVVKGKYSYLSPEAAHGQEIDARADLFSVGILGFEMLTGRRLFKGKNDFETIALVRRAQVPSIRRYNQEVPEQLERIMLRSLDPDITKRYQTADEFADALLEFLFSNRQKVSARDLIEFIRPIRAVKDSERREQERQAKEEKSPGGNNLIISLIKEEMLNFRSLGADGHAADRTGTIPVVTTEHVGAKPIDLGHFGASTSPTPTPLPRHSAELPTLSSLHDELGIDATPTDDPKPEASSRGVAPPQPTSGGTSPLVYVIVLLVLLLVGSIAYILISG
ncbi:MAG: serine/threonine protein kinase [Myxococcales bacterium]|nr:serine/threonine protein kinase [Myxococcales bacterium]